MAGNGGFVGGERLFISHAGADRAWAEWVAWQLQDAGYEIELDVWHSRAGDNFVLRMNEALERGRMVALLSEAYFDTARFTTEEWTAVLAARDKWVPVRVEDAPVPRIVKPLLTPELFGLDEEQARTVLLQAVQGPPGSPSSPPAFPGSGPGRLRQVGATGPRLPGSLPRVWNIPTRNAGFTGRDELLVRVRTRLAGTRAVAVLALNGWGGVGKTQLGIEYAYRFSGEYELAWWVRAEDVALIPEQLAALAVATGCARPDMPLAEAVQALGVELRTRARWLLVFDNAEDPAALAAYLPAASGHVLITSRNPRWHQVAAPVDVAVLARAESVALLQARSRGLSARDADRLAAALDDLPLALVQAAETLTAFTPGQYLALLERSPSDATEDGTPPDYPGSLAAQVKLSTQRLAEQDPDAAGLLHACALLAPEPFPLHACTPSEAPENGDVNGSPMVRVLSDPRAIRRVLTVLDRFGLARVTGGSVQLHRLTQAILRDQLSPDQHAHAAHNASLLLAAAYPGDAADPATWPRWPDILPHLLAVAPADLTTSRARYAAGAACWYLMDRGGARTVLPRLEGLHRCWAEQLGPDHDETLGAALRLARAYADTNDHARAHALDSDTLARQRRVLGEDRRETLRTAGNLALRLAELGKTEQARALAEDTLARQRRVVGEDHPDTLNAASNLANRLADLGQTEKARALAEDTLARHRRVVGEDDPDTLITASNLTNRLAALGQTEEARALGEDTLTRQRRVVGEDHPDTLRTASNLAINLAALGQTEQARALGEDTLTRQRRVLGDHPDTLNTAHNLAIDLAALGQTEQAHALGEDTLTRRLQVLGEDHPDTLRTADLLDRLK
ncbi:FxSxx-COOH system tetratricopeptide repeat protein [Streptomyces sp. NPDC002668]|uniref:FxSxx-COOH system tetratricopeptide repeat protein n=1 Tax=Streptomyces sp. NPDC002668 TaxID=3154422 RepID=UPI0033267A76